MSSKVTISQQLLSASMAQKQFIVQAMARFIPSELTYEAVPEQVQVTDRIQDFVLHKLIVIAKTILVQGF